MASYNHHPLAAWSTFLDCLLCVSLTLCVQVRNVTLLPSKIALQCARALGRGERTIRFLTS